MTYCIFIQIIKGVLMSTIITIIVKTASIIMVTLLSEEQVLIVFLML